MSAVRNMLQCWDALLSSHLPILLPTPNPREVVVISTDQGPHHVSALMRPVPVWESVTASLWRGALAFHRWNKLCLISFAVCSKPPARSLSTPDLMQQANPSGMMVACVPWHTQVLLCDPRRTMGTGWGLCFWDHTSSCHFFFSLRGASST